jgi:hypothetical protein
MPRDWPDPRFPHKPISAFEHAVAALAVGAGYAGKIWAVIDGLRRMFG